MNELIKSIQGLIEGTLDEGIRELRREFVESGKMSEENFNTVLVIDPTKTKKYSRWMCQQVSKGGEGKEHFAEGFLADYFKSVVTFHELVEKNQIENKDIGKYSSVEELNAEVKGKSTQEQEAEDAKAIAAGTTLVQDDSKVTVYLLNGQISKDSEGRETVKLQTTPEAIKAAQILCNRPDPDLPSRSGSNGSRWCIGWGGELDPDSHNRLKEEGESKQAALYLISAKGVYKTKFQKWVLQLSWKYENRDWIQNSIFWDWQNHSHSKEDPQVQEMVKGLGLDLGLTEATFTPPPKPPDSNPNRVHVSTRNIQIGDRVWVDKDDEEWGRIVSPGTVSAVNDMEEYLLVDVDTIRATLVVNPGEFLKVVESVNELAFQPQRSVVHPEKKAFIETGDEDLNKIVPNLSTEEQTYLEKIASTQYADMIQKIEAASGIRVSQTTLPSLIGLMFRSLPETMQIEQTHKSYLEEWAVMLPLQLDEFKSVEEAYKEGAVKFDVKLESPSLQDLAIDVPEEQPEQEGELSDAEELNSEAIDIMNVDTAKLQRRFANLLITGGATLKLSLFNLMNDKLEAISPRLPTLYGIMASLAQLGYWVTPMGVEQMAARSNTQRAGSEEVIPEEDGTYTIKARAHIFPFLVHEVVKGIYEWLSLSDSHKEELKKERLEHETEGFMFGPQLFKLLSSYIGADEQELMPVVQKMAAQLQPEEIKEVLANSTEGKRIMKNLVDDARSAWNQYQMDKEKYQKESVVESINEALSNYQLARRFVDGATSGRSSSMHIEDDVLYSYATPIALRYNNQVYVDSTSYSPTTARHFSEVRSAGGIRINRIQFTHLLKTVAPNIRTGWHRTPVNYEAGEFSHEAAIDFTAQDEEEKQFRREMQRQRYQKHKEELKRKRALKSLEEEAVRLVSQYNPDLFLEEDSQLWNEIKQKIVEFGTKKGFDSILQDFEGRCMRIVQYAIEFYTDEVQRERAKGIARDKAAKSNSPFKAPTLEATFIPPPISDEMKREAEEQEKEKRREKVDRANWYSRIKRAVDELAPDSKEAVEAGSGTITLSYPFGKATIELRNNEVDYLDAEVDSKEVAQEVFGGINQDLTNKIQDDFEETYHGGGWDKWREDWAKKNGFKLGNMRSGNTANLDSSYYLGDIYEYTHIENEQTEGLIIQWHRGGDYRGNYTVPYVYMDGEVSDFFMYQEQGSRDEIFQMVDLHYPLGWNQFEKDLNKYMEVIHIEENLADTSEEEIVTMIEDLTSSYPRNDLIAMSKTELIELYHMLVTRVESPDQYEMEFESKLLEKYVKEEETEVESHSEFEFASDMDKNYRGPSREEIRLAKVIKPYDAEIRQYLKENPIEMYLDRNDELGKDTIKDIVEESLEDGYYRHNDEFYESNLNYQAELETNLMKEFLKDHPELEDEGIDENWLTEEYRDSYEYGEDVFHQLLKRTDVPIGVFIPFSNSIDTETDPEVLREVINDFYQVTFGTIDVQNIVEALLSNLDSRNYWEGVMVLGEVGLDEIVEMKLRNWKLLNMQGGDALLFNGDSEFGAELRTAESVLVSTKDVKLFYDPEDVG